MSGIQRLTNSKYGISTVLLYRTVNIAITSFLVYEYVFKINYILQVKVSSSFTGTCSFKNIGVSGKVQREIRRAVEKEPKLMKHTMEHPLELLQTLHLTSSLRALSLSQP